MEVNQQSRFFRPDGRMIKQRIEYLMGAGSLRRESDSHASAYQYVCPLNLSAVPWKALDWLFGIHLLAALRSVCRYVPENSNAF